MKTFSIRTYLKGLFCESRARVARRLYVLARRLDPDADLHKVSRSMATSPDDPLVDMLYRALGNRTGKLRVSDAFLICGLEAGKVSQDQIVRFGHAIRELGWERMRRRFDGVVEYAYVKGTPTERTMELSVDYDPHMRSVRIQPAIN